MSLNKDVDDTDEDNLKAPATTQLVGKCTTTNDYYKCPNKGRDVPLYDNSRYECSREPGHDAKVTRSDHQLCFTCASTHDQCPICDSDVIDGEPDPKPLYK